MLLYPLQHIYLLSRHIFVKNRQQCSKQKWVSHRIALSRTIKLCPIGKCYDGVGLVLVMMQIVKIYIVKINLKWNRYVQNVYV